MVHTAPGIPQLRPSDLCRLLIVLLGKLLLLRLPALIHPPGKHAPRRMQPCPADMACPLSGSHVTGVELSHSVSLLVLLSCCFRLLLSLSLRCGC